MANVAGKKLELLASVARTATATSEPLSLPNNAKDIGIVLNTTADSGTGTFTAKLQTSSDNINWTDVTGATSAAVSDIGQSFGFASVNCFSLVRCVLTESGTAVATQSVHVVFNEGP